MSEAPMFDDKFRLKYGIYFFLMLSALITIFVLYFTIERTPGICDDHEELFRNEIRSGVVVKRFVDQPNHAMRTVLIKEGEKIYTVYIVPDSNYDDFIGLNVNDKITKQPNSFVLEVNQRYSFKLNFNCK